MGSLLVDEGMSNMGIFCVYTISFLALCCSFMWCNIIQTSYQICHNSSPTYIPLYYKFSLMSGSLRHWVRPFLVVRPFRGMHIFCVRLKDDKKCEEHINDVVEHFAVLHLYLKYGTELCVWNQYSINICCYFGISVIYFGMLIARGGSNFLVWFLYLFVVCFSQIFHFWCSESKQLGSFSIFHYSRLNWHSFLCR